MIANHPNMWRKCFKRHCLHFYADPLSVHLFHLSLHLPISPSPFPSVMALVHPHVYLCYKAEESGRLKMKTPTRECLCAHFVSMYCTCTIIWCTGCVWVGEGKCTLLSFCQHFFFIFRGRIFFSPFQLWLHIFFPFLFFFLPILASSS